MVLKGRTGIHTIHLIKWSFMTHGNVSTASGQEAAWSETEPVWLGPWDLVGTGPRLRNRQLMLQQAGLHRLLSFLLFCLACFSGQQAAMFWLAFVVKVCLSDRSLQGGKKGCVSSDL